MADIVVNKYSTTDIDGLTAALDAKADVLTANKTVNIPFGSTASEIQALIDAEPKNGGGHSLTFQFADCPYKYFNGTTDKLVGNGTTVTVTHDLHGFTSGQEVSIDILREQFFTGSTTIVGNGTNATVTRNAHGFKNGDYVKIIGTVNFDGTYEISSVATNTFVITHAYNGSETAPVTASVNSLNFDGDYTITVVDENTYTFASTVTGTIIPLSTGITRRVWDLGSSSLEFSRFSNLIIFIQGNTETGTGLHTNQRVYLKSTANSVIDIADVSASTTCYIQNIKVASSGINGIIVATSDLCRVRYCFALSGNAVGRPITAVGGKVLVQNCVVGSYTGTGEGVRFDERCYGNVVSGIRTYNRSVNYGIRVISAILILAVTANKGLIADTLETYEGTIFS